MPKRKKRTLPKRTARRAPARPQRRTFSPERIRLMWTGFAAGLMAALLLDFCMHPHGVFGIEGTRFFHAWYGFVACAAIVVLSRWLGFLLKRPTDYYAEDK